MTRLGASVLGFLAGALIATGWTLIALGGLCAGGFWLLTQAYPPESMANGWGEAAAIGSAGLGALLGGRLLRRWMRSPSVVDPPESGPE